MCVITNVAINSVIVYLTKKPLSGLIYFAGGFRARGVLTATAGFATGAALGRAGALGFLARAVVATGTGSGAISLALGNGQSVLGASTLYGAKVSGCFGLAKKPFKNRNIWFSYTVIY
jgi:hypothetical protein